MNDLADSEDCLDGKPMRRPQIEGKGRAERKGCCGVPDALCTSYVFRRNFDAACRLAGLVPKIAYESRTPHTLLVMAESGHGVAIIPSALRTKGRPLRLAAVTYRGRPLREHSTIYWDRRRPLPGYAKAFCEMLADYMRATFPISRPTSAQRSSKRQR